MSTRLLWLFPFVIALAGCGGMAREPGSAPAAGPLSLSTVTAAAQQWPSTYEATGTVRPRSSAVISAKWMGYVREVKVQVGNRVRAGQLLVALDARELDAGSNRAEAATQEIRGAMPEADSAVAAAKANLNLAQVTFNRMNELYGKKSISDQEFDEASAKLKASQASCEMARAKRTQLDSKLAQAEQELRAAQVSRSYAQLEAPFAGIVTAKSVEPGNLAIPGAPLLTIERDGYRLEASVEESKLSAIRTGQQVSATVDGFDRPFDARVSEIVPTVDATSRAYIVKIDLPTASGLRSGVFGRATFPLGSREVLAVPAAAVIERGQLVFVVDGGIARTRLITLGAKTGDQMEVLSGLAAGDKVVVPVPKDLMDGARAEVKP
jgi:RND family efflux transporter MFP subunit